MAKKRPKKKRERKAFWKKYPELERIAGHIGHALDNMKASDYAEIAVMAGLAYAGYQAFGDWKGSLFGPIALKLALAPNTAGSVAGVIGLTTLGLAFAVPYEGEIIPPRPSIIPAGDNLSSCYAEGERRYGQFPNLVEKYKAECRRLFP